MKSVFIIPYFGKFPNYFELFLNSCAKSNHFDFIIYTDNKDEYHFPKNVKKVAMTLQDMKLKMESKIHKSVCLSSAYKLCDYKPMYGMIFEDEIQKYSYWGYCDIDLIFGDVDSILTPIIEKNYDKIFDLGHCSLIKNTPENNRLFLKSKNIDTILSNECIYIFDEQYNNSINNLFIENNKKLYTNNSLIADIYIWGQLFYCTVYNYQKYEFEIRKEKSLFIYDNGKVLNYRLDNGNLIKTEYLYIHLQQRKMKMSLKNKNYYKIIPNQFKEIQLSTITSHNFKKISLGYINYQKISLKFRLLKLKFLKILRRNS